MEDDFCLLAHYSSVHVLDVGAEIVLAMLGDEPHPLTSWNFNFQFFGWVVEMVYCEIIIAFLAKFQSHNLIMLKQDLVIAGGVVHVLRPAVYGSVFHEDFSECLGKVLTVDPHFECKLVGARFITCIFVVLCGKFNFLHLSIRSGKSKKIKIVRICLVKAIPRWTEILALPHGIISDLNHVELIDLLEDASIVLGIIQLQLNEQRR